MDRSGSMWEFYHNSSMQNLAEQVLGLAAHFDDDGSVPVVYFDGKVVGIKVIEIGKHQGVVAEHHKKFGGDSTMGGTNYASAMRAVIEDYQKTYRNHDVPAFVVFQTDGATNNRDSVEALLCHSSYELPIFWQFIGFGSEHSGDFAFLRKLDEGLPVPSTRKVDNANFFALGTNPKGVDDKDLYDRLMAEFPAYLAKARAEGILKG
jgi:hypothetical protein